MSVRGIKITANDECSWVDVDGLSEYQAIVGGYIEAVRLRDGAFMFINEEGKFQGLAPNFIATRLAMLDVIVGDAIVVGPPDAGGEDTSLPETSVTADDVRNIAASINATWV